LQLIRQQATTLNDSVLKHLHIDDTVADHLSLPAIMSLEEHVLVAQLIFNLAESLLGGFVLLLLLALNSFICAKLAL
jgi:hypothetical protein